jgi:PAS domain S-box-containing protein
LDLDLGMESDRTQYGFVNASDYRYEYLFENANDAILIFEPNAEVILNANEKACQLYGFEKSELIGISLKQLTKNVAQGEAEIQKLLRQLTVKNYETQHYRKDGSQVDLLINSAIIEYEGQPAILSINRDVSERKRAEEALSKSEANLQTIFENTDIGYILMSDTLQIRSFNRPAGLFIFRKHGKILQKEDVLFNYFPPERIAGLKLMLQSVLEGKVMEYERNLFKSKTETYWYAVKFTPISGKNQKITGVVMMIENITERKQNEIVLQRSLKEISDYKFALDASSIVSITNPRGTIMYVNDNFCKISKYTSEELVGGDHAIVNSGFHPKSFFRDLWNTIALGKIWKGEICNKAKDGTLYWVDNTILPFLDAQGRPYQYISIRNEITERKQAEFELQKSYNLVSDQNKRLLNFSYIVSHNLRSHASNIKTILSFLQEADDPQERKMMLGHLETVADRLDETLHNLNEVVSIQQNSNLQLELLDLYEYVQKALELLQDQINTKEVRIQSNISTQTHVRCNAAYLESILFNFISNAIKYSHPDRIPEVKIDYFKKENNSLLHIEDNGIGIDLEKNGDKLFGMYKTFHGNKDAKGLGLFIAKNQIEAMGGKVDVRSTLGLGTTFMIYIL